MKTGYNKETPSKIVLNSSWLNITISQKIFYQLDLPRLIDRTIVAGLKNCRYWSILLVVVKCRLGLSAKLFRPFSWQPFGSASSMSWTLSWNYAFSCTCSKYKNLSFLPFMIDVHWKSILHLTDKPAFTSRQYIFVTVPILLLTSG